MSANYILNNPAWLGEIPSHWDCKKIGSLFTERKVKVSDKEYPPLSVAKIGVVPQLDTAVKTDAGDNRKLVRIGDFVINSRSDRKGSCGVSELDGSVSLINIVLTPRNQWNSRYVHYLLRSHPFSEEYYRNGRGIVADLWTTRYSEMKSILLPVPPRPEQDQIVRFLDWKASTVNKLIALKRKQITLLEEHKASVLNTAVTRGSQLNHSLKYSGLKWLPNVPEHWEIVPAKALFSNKRELRHDNDKMMAATQKYGIISQKKYMELEGRRIVLANDNLDKWLHVEPDDFIISLRSFQGGIERCIEAGCVTWHYVVLRPNREVVPTFYRWFFKSPAYISALQHTSDFIRDGQDLRYSNFVKVRLLKIPLTEQIEIAEYLDKAMPRYDTAIIKREEEIQTLCEFRSRLISDVVTGKIDVRGIEIPECEYMEETNLTEESNEQDYEDFKEEEA